MGPTPMYGARAEKPLQNADFAMKQTNICRLSGDINMPVNEFKMADGMGLQCVECFFSSFNFILDCFDIVAWMTGTASGL